MTTKSQNKNAVVVTTTIKVKPITVPNFIVPIDEKHDVIPISRFSDSELWALGERFTEDLVDLARKRRGKVGLEELKPEPYDQKI